MLSLPFANHSARNSFQPWRSPYFYVLFLILSVTAGLFLLGSLQSFRSEVSVILVPRSENVSFQTEQVIGNVTDIFRRLSFYDRILFDNPGIRDGYALKSKDERKALWNRDARIIRADGSTTLNITIFRNSRSDAEMMARQAAASLSNAAGRYYDIQNELEIRVLEGPITSPVVRHPFWVVFLGALIGFFLSLILVWIGSRPRMIRRSPEIIEQENRFEAFDGKDFFHPVHPAEPEVGEGEYVFSKRSSAPDNLPIAEEEIVEPEIFAEPASDHGLAEEKKPQGEPTEEEYRARLNKLLRGDL